MDLPHAFGRVVHLQALSLQDFPGRLATILFFAGCNFRCPFCYNAELVLPELYARFAPIPWEEVLKKLAERRDFLDGVVLSGGEPLLSPDILDFTGELKKLGYDVKLDTNGASPEALEKLLTAGLVDYVALDIKAPFPRYPEFTGLAGGENVVIKVRETLDLLQAKAPDYELRTTLAPGLSQEDLLAIASEIRGVRRYAIQLFFRPPGKKLVDESWRKKPALNEAAVRAILPELQKYVSTELRA